MHKLFRNYLLSIRRSPLFKDRLVKYIVSFIIFIYLYINLFSLGLSLDRLFLAIKPDIRSIDTFSIYCLFLLVLDLIIKLLFKSTKNVDILSYLTIPVPRNKIYSMLLIIEMLSGWNLIWVVLLIPFFINTVYEVNGFTSTFLLILSTYIVSLSISFIVRYIKILLIRKSIWFVFVPILLIVCLGCIAYYISTISLIFINIDLIFSQNKLKVAIGLFFFFLCFFFLFIKSCRREFYSFINNKKRIAFIIDFSRNSFGIKGEIVQLCLREIVRSKLKLMVLWVFILLMYCLYLLNNEWGNFLTRCLIALFSPILLGRLYGGNTFSIESTFFDKLMVLPQNTPYLILITKFAFCVIHIAINTIISMIVCNNSTSILFWTSSFFYGCGIVQFFIFQNAVYNKERIDILESSAKFSNLSTSLIMQMILLTIPTGVILIAIEKITSEETALYILLITGVLGLLVSYSVPLCSDSKLRIRQ